LPAAPGPSAADTRIAEIERALSAYERGYETLDLSTLRMVMDLSAEQEKRLREAFKTFKSYEIEMSHGPVEFQGDGRARLRVSSLHTVNGRRLPPVTQVFVLTPSGNAWRIAFER
jgi:hypothetical protein